MTTNQHTEQSEREDLSFEQIEDCFPEGSGCNEYGQCVVPAQWLHDFARNIQKAAAMLAAEKATKHPDEFLCPLCYDDPANIKGAADKTGVEPVAWVINSHEVDEHGKQINSKELDYYADDISALAVGTKLYTRPQPQAEEVRVPDGYALVPVEPTRVMLDSGITAFQKNYSDSNPLSDWIANYRAMLAAAPKP